MPPASARKKGRGTGPSPVDRGKTGSKHHLICDGKGTLFKVITTAANVNDVTQTLALVDGIVPVAGKPGRPRRRPDALLGDKGYDSNLNSADYGEPYFCHQSSASDHGRPARGHPGSPAHPGRRPRDRWRHAQRPLPRGRPHPKVPAQLLAPHRNGFAWSKRGAHHLLCNPSHTGHEIRNKQRKEEVPLDVDDVTLDHRTKLTWNARRTLQALQEAQKQEHAPTPAVESAKRTVKDCDARLRLTRYRAALDSGADPAVVAGWITQAQKERDAAQHQLLAAAGTEREILTEEQIDRMIKALGDMSDRLQTAEPERKAPLYADFGINLLYNAKTRIVTVESQPAPAMCVIACPRGTRTIRTCRWFGGNCG